MMKITLLGLILIVFGAHKFRYTNALSAGDVIWAVNAGGDTHIDVNGIKYMKDTLVDGVPSDYGKSLLIQRVPPQDMVLYQTERYHHTSFSYKIPIKEDGDYVLVLKFCEVWFNAPNQKVFHVQLNEEHDVVEDMDIFGKVGRGVAHDEVIPFKVKNKMLIVEGKKSPINNGKVNLKLVKGERDNPKINAAYVMKGTVADVPVLPPLPTEDEDQEDMEDMLSSQKNVPTDDSPRKSHSSGRKVQDPYAMDDSTSYVIPIAIAIGAFAPLLYCLCKI